MNRTLRRSAALLLAVPLAVAAFTVWSSTASASASAAPASASASAVIDIPMPYRVTYESGVTEGTYSVVQQPLGITTTLTLSGHVASTVGVGCYTAQVVVRRSGITSYASLATACTPTPVVYNYRMMAIISQSPTFGIRLCLVGGGCSAVKPLPPLGIVPV